MSTDRTNTVEEKRYWRLNFGEAAASNPGLIALIVMALAGIAVAIYLITVEADNVPLICSTSGLVDCASVLKSSYSRVPFTKVPITVPGLLWFVVSGGLAVVALVRGRRGLDELPRLRLSQFLWSAVGLLFVLYLVYAEIVQLHRICAWCTVIHGLTLLTFLLTLHRLQHPAVAELSPRLGDARRAIVHPSARGINSRTGRTAHGAVPSRRAVNRARAHRK